MKLHGLTRIPKGPPGSTSAREASESQVSGAGSVSAGRRTKRKRRDECAEHDSARALSGAEAHEKADGVHQPRRHQRPQRQRRGIGVQRLRELEKPRGHGPPEPDGDGEHP
jgi:hypothetical protein